MTTERDLSDVEDAELLAWYARVWLELTQKQDLHHALFHELKRRNLWPFSGRHPDSKEKGWVD